MNLHISRGRVIDPASGLDQHTDLYIENGRITGIGRPPEGFSPTYTLNVGGHIVVPGLVDIAARLREPGQEHKATIASETQAAAASGITTLCCQPDTLPVADSPAEIKFIQQQAEKVGYCRVYTLGALTAGLQGQTLSEMAALKRGGCVGVGNALKPMSSTLVLRRAMEYAASQHLTLHIHPIDHSLADTGCAHEGQVATRLGLPGIPAAAETAALGLQLAMIELTGVSTHFCRLSTARAAKMVARARHGGLPVSADICVHQLFLTEENIADYNSLCHTIPPLRTKSDLKGLRASLRTDAIRAICSDHQPHELDAKQAPFPNTEPGVSALETLLPLTLRLVEEKVLSLQQAIALLTCKPAEIMNIDAGTLRVGSPADICIFRPDITWELDPERMLSRGKNTPFAGWRFQGKVTHTLLGGEIVYERNDH